MVESVCAWFTFIYIVSKFIYIVYKFIYIVNYHIRNVVQSDSGLVTVRGSVSAG